MFVLILVCLVYVSVDFGTPKSTQTCKRPAKINTNIQKTHQNQHKHAKEPPKSTQTYKRTTKINKNMVLLYVCVDFGGSFACFC
jgi:hypothetical protein